MGIYGRSNDEAPWLLQYRSSKTWIMAVVLSSVFTHYLLWGMLVTVIPYALNGQVGTAPADAQKWTSILLAVYGGTFAVAAPLLGYITDHMPTRRHALLLDMIFCMTATIFFTIAIRIEVLVLGRVFQALSGALLFTTGSTLIVDTYDVDVVGRALGWMSCVNIASLSPFLGGLIYDHAGYRPTFAMVFACLAVCLLLRLGMIERKVAHRWLENLEAEEHETVTAMSKEDRESRSAIGDLITEKQLDDSKVHEEIPRKPMQTDLMGIESAPLPPRRKLPAIVEMLLDLRFLVALWATLSFNTLLVALDAVVPLYVKDTYDWSAGTAGLCFVPLALPFIFGPLTGRLIDRYGTRWPAVLALCSATPAFICLRFTGENDTASKVLLFALLLILGVAFAVMTLTTQAEIPAALRASAVMSGRETDKIAFAQGYGLYECVNGLGCLVGPLLAGFLRDSRGWNVLMVVMGSFSFSTAVLAALGMGEPLRVVARRSRDCSA